MTVQEYEAFVATLSPYERRMIHLMEKIERHLDEIAAVGRD